MTQEATATTESTQEAETTETEETEATETTEATAEVETESEGKTYDEDYVKKLRSEAAKHRTELKKEREAREALENEKLSEDERVKKQAEADKARADALESRVKRAEIRAAAPGKGIANPEIAAQLIDPARIELNDQGEATNAGELLDELLDKYPDLKKAEATTDDRPNELRKVLKDGEPVAEDGRPIEGEAARRLLETDPDKFNDLMDKGLIKGL